MEKPLDFYIFLEKHYIVVPPGGGKFQKYFHAAFFFAEKTFEIYYKMLTSSYEYSHKFNFIMVIFDHKKKKKNSSV